MSAPSIYKSPAGERAVMAWYEALLARWPVPYEARHIPTRYGHTFVVASGDPSAPPLVLLHGAGSNSAAWAGDVAEYGRGHQVYAVDLLGEPGKSAPHRPAWDGPAYAEWLEDVLNALNVERATLIGLSQGGWAALKFAVYRPEQVESLVLLTPGGITPDRWSFVLRAIPLSLLGQWGIERLNRMIWAGQPVAKEVSEATALIMAHFRTRLGVLSIFADAELQRLTMPVLLLIGARDALRDGERIAARVHKFVPHLTAIIIPEAGHALVHTAMRVGPFLATRSQGRSEHGQEECT